MYGCVVVICGSCIGVKMDEVVWFWGFMDSDYKGLVVRMVGGEQEDGVIKSGSLLVTAWAKVLDIFWVGFFL